MQDTSEDLEQLIIKVLLFLAASTYFVYTATLVLYDLFSGLLSTQVEPYHAMVMEFRIHFRESWILRGANISAARIWVQTSDLSNFTVY